MQHGRQQVLVAQHNGNIVVVDPIRLQVGDEFRDILGLCGIGRSREHPDNVAGSQPRQIVVRRTVGT